MQREPVGSHDGRGGRHRNRQQAVLAAHLTGTFCQTGKNDPVDSQIIDTYGNRSNIHDRIYCPHFVKMHLAEGLSVNLAFCFRHNAENFQCQLQCAGSQLSCGKNGCDIIQIPSVMFMCMVDIILMRMIGIAGKRIFLMVMAFMTVTVKILHIVVMILMDFIQNHTEITGLQSGFGHSGYFRHIALQRKAGQCGEKHLLIRTQIQQRGNRHITADTAGAVQVKRCAGAVIYFIHIINFLIQ